MKIGKVIVTLCLLLSFTPAAFSETKRGIENADYYGIINGLYTYESRIVISDLSLQYKKHKTRFINSKGKRISSIVKALKEGTAVKYHLYRQRSNLILKDLQIVSRQEYNRSVSEEGE